MDADGPNDAGVLDAIEDERPDIIAATLYAWNIERTLRILGQFRKSHPRVRIVVGGPEVAPGHPFLMRARCVDVAVSGEGEAVFPSVLRGLQNGRAVSSDAVAWRAGGRLKWGRGPAVVPELASCLPPPDDDWLNASGRTACVETTRGCPLDCVFCCYSMRRRRLAFVPAAAVAERVALLAGSGAREVRFVDPSLNAHPQFELLLAELARVNRAGSVEFLAELLADRLTARQAGLLAAAGFGEIEIGLQSVSPEVLRAVNRRSDPALVLRGARLLGDVGVRPVIDVMCGLPGQTLEDVKRSVETAAGVRNARVQLLHALLLPGTVLGSRRRELGLEAQALPPYRVISTPHMSAEDMIEADRFAAGVTGLELDAPAGRYVGRSLPSLFAEQHVLAAGSAVAPLLPGTSARRALILDGDDLFGHREWVACVIRRAIRTEPHTLWQFVLSPWKEEPLDLADFAAGVIAAERDHFLDRLKPREGTGHTVSRRVFILLKKQRRYSVSWQTAAEELLSRLFY